MKSTIKYAQEHIYMTSICIRKKKVNWVSDASYFSSRKTWYRKSTTPDQQSQQTLGSERIKTILKPG